MQEATETVEAMTKQAENAPAFAILGKGTSAPFPILPEIWTVFHKKGIRTVFLSIGTSSSSMADLEVAESIGCPLHIITTTEEEAAGWIEVADVLKKRKRDPAVHTHSFSEGAENRWMLAKNVRVSRELPWWSAGTLQLGGTTVATKECVPILQEMCKAMKLPEEQLRIDILKVDVTQTAPGLERPVLSAILDAGCRPSILLVRWAEMPSSHLATTHAAGHLQIMGYQLLTTLGNAFLYYYTDKDLFQICSWEDNRYENPFLTEILRASPVAPVAPVAPPGTSLSEAEGEATTK